MSTNLDCRSRLAACKGGYAALVARYAGFRVSAPLHPAGFTAFRRHSKTSGDELNARRRRSADGAPRMA
jgi:hypothetical protein